VSASLGLRPTESLRRRDGIQPHPADDDSEFAQPPAREGRHNPRARCSCVVGEHAGAPGRKRRRGHGDLSPDGACSPPNQPTGFGLTLFFYEPTPGTVVFFGYGRSMNTDRPSAWAGWSDQRRLFLKLAYCSLLRFPAVDVI
jgi:hypothetical protein